MVDRTFISLTSEKIANQIKSANQNVIFAAPGLDEIIADAIVDSVTAIGNDNVSVCIDINEKPCRLGFGTIKAVSRLKSKNIEIRHAPNIRIGVLICDGDGWIFSPTPLLIEAGSIDDYEPNAIKASATQIEQLIQSINPTIDVNDTRILSSDFDSNQNIQASLFDTEHEEESNFITRALTPEIGQNIISNEKIENVKQPLDDNPPQKFDIARKVQVFESFIEFVEIRLIGCEIHRHTATIPSKLLVGGADKQTIRQLRAGFQLIDRNSISNQNLRDKVNQLRRDYLRSIQKYGNVILKSNKNRFVDEIEKIRLDLSEFQKSVNESIEQEILKSKKRLIEVLIPAIMDKPPQELIGQIAGDTPSKEQSTKFLELEINKIFPTPEKIIKEMSLECIFKAVTYETISNEDFQKKIREAFPLVDWPKPFKEFDAVKGKSK